MSDDFPQRPRGRGAQLLEKLRRRQQEVAEASAAEVMPHEEAAGAPGAPGALPAPPGPPRPPIARLSALSLFERPSVHRRGSGGKPFSVVTNFVRLDREEGFGFHEYQVRFQPEVDSREARFRLMNQQREALPTRTFDGVRLLLPCKLGEEKLDLKSVEPGSRQEYQISLTYIRNLSTSDPLVQMMINSLLVKIFRSSLKLANIPRGLSKGCYYDPANKHELKKHKLEVWPGYEIHAEEFEGGLLLQIHSSPIVMRTETVLSVIKECAKKCPGTYKEEATKLLLGRSVVTRYNNRSYKIDDIDWDSSPEDSFDTPRGKITFLKYVKNQYGIEVRDPGQPMIINRKPQINQPRDAPPLEIKLIPEFCCLTGMTEVQRQDFRCMKDVAEFARQPPEKRRMIMEQLLKTMLDSKDACQSLDNWGLKMGEAPLEVEARLLGTSTLTFGGGYKEAITGKGDWTRTATTRPVLKSVELKTWSLIFPEKERSVVKSFYDVLVQQAPRMGIRIALPKVVPISTDRAEAYLGAIRAVPEGTQMTMTVFPGAQRADRYAAVKKLCYLERGEANQCVLVKSMMNERRLQSVAQKIALQMNCKLGGELWGLRIPVPNLMVVGVDVYRSKGADTKGRNVTAVVSSLNATFGKFHSRVFFEKRESGASAAPGGATGFDQDLVQVVVEAVSAYRKENEGQEPEHIIIYRDGVSAGQLYSFESEGKNVVDNLSQLLGPKEGGASVVTAPKVSYVVIHKKMPTRVYQHAKGMKAENPPPGLVLDHTITQRDWYDFYLVPMSVTLGTVTPIHFTVVAEPGEGDGFEPKIMQRLSYALTHMYFNWTGNVKVPAPCQYAHKLVEMTGEHLHKVAHPQLREKLFYL